MERIAQFYKVSDTQFEKDWPAHAAAAAEVYARLALPRRATAGSAGYDFYAPMDWTLMPGESIKVPTGVRVRMASGWVLLLLPRSGLGFRYRLQMDNTAGVIDSDYFDADNEGHIFIKLTNDSRDGKALQIRAGEAFAQGIFLPFGITQDDEATEIRTGGFGSTTKQP